MDQISGLLCFHKSRSWMGDCDRDLGCGCLCRYCSVPDFPGKMAEQVEFMKRQIISGFFYIEMGKIAEKMLDKGKCIYYNVLACIKAGTLITNTGGE